MAMKYDPIMCMMVPDTVKTKDGLYDPEKNAGYEMKKEGQYFKVYKNGKLIAMKSTEEEARREAARHRAANDSNTIDKAITTCDKTEFDPQDVSYIRKAIGSLKVANSLLGMINEGNVNKAKQNIANTISLLESID